MYDTHCPEQRGRRRGAVLSPVSKSPLTGHSAPALLNQQGRDALSGRGKERGAADNRAHRSLEARPSTGRWREAQGSGGREAGPTDRLRTEGLPCKPGLDGGARVPTDSRNGSSWESHPVAGNIPGGTLTHLTGWTDRVARGRCFPWLVTFYLSFSGKLFPLISHPPPTDFIHCLERNRKPRGTCGCCFLKGHILKITSFLLNWSQHEMRCLGRRR